MSRVLVAFRTGTVSSFALISCLALHTAPRSALADGTCACDGDVSGNGSLDAIDIIVISDCLKGSPHITPEVLAACDVNCDGNLDGEDFFIVLCQVLEFFPDAPAACCDAPKGACCDSTAGVPSYIRCSNRMERQCDSFDELDEVEFLGVGTTCELGPCDCNDNSIDDLCDTDCGPIDGVCNVDGCGQSPDCNGNGVPDECEEVDPNTIGACCFENEGVVNCGDTTLEICGTNLSGVWAGPCTECPDQSVGIILEPGGGIFVHVIGPPADCQLPKARGQRAGEPCVPGERIDPWVSPADGSMCHVFGVTGSPAIPADFFEPGSDPFNGTICLQGIPLGDAEFPLADTLILRSEDPFDRCDIPSPTERTVDIEIVALSLESLDPITVVIGNDPTDCDNNGQDDATEISGNPGLDDNSDGVLDRCQWHVDVDLSDVDAPLGSLTSTMTHSNGGTFTSLIPVLPRFTFQNLTGITEDRVLDTGLEGLDPVVLVQDDDRPWVVDVDTLLPVEIDVCSRFHAGIKTTFLRTLTDCNENLIQDKCELEQDPSKDCNLNNRLDECDISQGLSPDVDEDGRPDECPAAQVVLPSLLADPSGHDKNRFVSFIVPPSGLSGTARSGDTPVAIESAPMRSGLRGMTVRAIYPTEQASGSVASNPAAQPAGALSSGFEAAEGFSPGPIFSQNGWSAFQVAPEAHIDTVNPQNAGGQHLRISKDVGLVNGTLTGAFSPDFGPLPTGPSVVEVDVSIDAIGGAAYIVVGQSPSEGFLTWNVVFNWTGDIFVLDDPDDDGVGAFFDTGFDWDIGIYKKLRVCDNPETGTTEYYYGGLWIYSQLTRLPGTRIEQVVLYSDNFQTADSGDFDNISIANGVPCDHWTAIQIELTTLNHICAANTNFPFKLCSEHADCPCPNPLPPNSDCISGTCETEFGESEGQVRYVNVVRTCQGGCAEGKLTCRSVDDCPKTCQGDGANNGSSCANNSECDSGNCQNMTCVPSDSGAACEVCDVNADCDSGLCENLSACIPMRTCQGGSESGDVSCSNTANCMLGGDCLLSMTCPDDEFKPGFLCATTGCDPQYRDWAGDLAGAVLHAYGPGIVPARSEYNVRQIPAACAGNEATCASASPALMITTARWGDMTADGATNSLDITAASNKIQPIPEALTKPRTMLISGILNPLRNVNVLELQNTIDAVRELPMPGFITGPEDCGG